MSECVCVCACVYVYTLVCINADTQKWMSEDNLGFCSSLSTLNETGIMLFCGNSPFSTFYHAVGV